MSNSNDNNLEYSNQLYQLLGIENEEETEISKKYASAITLKELNLIAAEQIFICAVLIMFSFKYPKRGNIILKIMKIAASSAYNDYWNRNFMLLLESLLLVVSELKNYLDMYYPEIILQQGFYYKISGSAASFYDKILELPPDLYETFRSCSLDIIGGYNFKEKNSRSIQMKKICEAHGKNPSKSEIGQFIIATLQENILCSLDPENFVINYKRLYQF